MQRSLKKQPLMCSMQTNRVVRGAALMVLCLLFGASGCATPWSSKISFPWEDKAKPQIPDRVTVMWTDTILQQTGKPPTRGFGGRVFFYRGKDEQPIKVRGTLIVYAFDDSEGEMSHSTPARKYVFLPDQVEKHYSESALGPSYSFWLPWDPVGGVQKKISLITRFEPEKGVPVLSELTHHLLPGLPPEMIASGSQGSASGGSQSKAAANTVRPASFQTTTTTAAASAPNSNNDAEMPNGAASDRSRQQTARRMSTSTIVVPPATARRLLKPLPSTPMPQAAERNAPQAFRKTQPQQPLGAPPQRQPNTAAQTTSVVPMQPNATVPFPQQMPVANVPAVDQPANVQTMSSSPDSASTLPPATTSVQPSSAELSAGYQRGQSRVPGGTIARPVRGRVAMRPSPRAWPSAPQPIPRSFLGARAVPAQAATAAPIPNALPATP